MQESIGRLRQDSAQRLLDDSFRFPPLGGSLKRALDVTVASIALVTLLPLIVLTAIIIRSLTKEPAIVSERLIGRDGKIFCGYAFRLPIESGSWFRHFAEALRGSGLHQLPRFL